MSEQLTNPNSLPPDPQDEPTDQDLQDYMEELLARWQADQAQPQEQPQPV